MDHAENRENSNCGALKVKTGSGAGAEGLSTALELTEDKGAATASSPGRERLNRSLSLNTPARYFTSVFSVSK